MTTIRRRTHTIDGSVVTLACIAAALLLWQGAEYSGLVAHLGEWQFGFADRYWPTLTVAAIVLLALLVVGIVTLLRRRHHARRHQETLTPAALFDRAVIGETRLLRMSVAIGIVGIVGALFCFLTALRIVDTGPVQTVDTAATAAPPEGPARLTGSVDTSHIAVLTRTVLFARQQIFLAPVVRRDGTARYLIQLQRIETPRERWIAPREGLLRQFDTARELAPLYTRVNITLDEQPYVLFRSAETLRWAWKAAAAQSAVFALIAGAFALIFRRRRKKLFDSRSEVIVAA